MPSVAEYAREARAKLPGLVQQAEDLPPNGRSHRASVSVDAIFASSAESVGEFWFGQVAKCVIQSDFQCPGGAEPIRPFGDHSGLSVEAFDNATGELPPGSEPVQKQASSAESVGEFWFGQVAKCVIQSDFQCPGGAEPIRPFGDHSGLSVEAFDNATGELPPGSEPVQKQVAVRAQPCGQPPSSGRAASASSGCTSGRGTGRPSTATRSPTAIESPP